MEVSSSMELNRRIDHTCLKLEATKADILQLIAEAKKARFYSVCVQPVWVELASQSLKEDPVSICTVIGFPLGANTTETKVFEAQNALQNGADELDVVLNIGALKTGEHEAVLEDLKAVILVAKNRALVKVIIEAALLTEEEKIVACQLAKEAGANFVKTSTGFAATGATPSDVRLMRKVVGETMGVKASGGIKTAKEVRLLIESGASRIGTSASVAILAETI